MPNYTKGEWKVSRPLDNITYLITQDNPIAEMRWGAGIYEDAQRANANLIVEAVNACIKLNPDNPLAVAQSISALYEALKEAQMVIARAELAKGNIHRLAVEEQMIKALSKAEGK